MLRCKLGFGACLLLAVLAGLVPAVYAQGPNSCVANTVKESIQTNGVKQDPQSGLWSISWTTTVTWNCPGGVSPGCTVCEQGTYCSGVYGTTSATPITSQYGQNGPVSCNSGPNTGNWLSQVTNIPSGGNYFVQEAYKIWTSSNGCSGTNNYLVAAYYSFSTY